MPPSLALSRDRIGITALALTLLIGVLIQGGLVVALFTFQVSDWSLVQQLLRDLSQLNFLLAGGLLALTRPQGPAH